MDATDVEPATPTETTQRDSASAPTNSNVVARNRRVNDNNMVGQTVYTVYSNPKVYSYKELSATHTQEDAVRLERVRKLIFEIKKSPKYGGDIMRGFVTRKMELADSRCLMNLSNLFYDNLYQEEIKGSPFKQSYFLLAFQNFVNGLKFTKDKANNVVV